LQHLYCSLYYDTESASQSSSAYSRYPHAELNRNVFSSRYNEFVNSWL